MVESGKKLQEALTKAQEQAAIFVKLIYDTLHVLDDTIEHLDPDQYYDADEMAEIMGKLKENLEDHRAYLGAMIEIDEDEVDQLRSESLEE